MGDVKQLHKNNDTHFVCQVTTKTYDEFLHDRSSSNLEELYLRCKDYPGITRDILMMHHCIRHDSGLTFIKKTGQYYRGLLYT